MLLLLNLAACPPLARSADLPQPKYYRWGAQLQVAAAAAEAHRIRRDESQYPQQDVARASAYTSIYSEDPHKILSLLVV